jgi:hypothetical protein
MVSDQHRQKQKMVSETQTKSKRTRIIAQVVESLPNKCKASSGLGHQYYQKNEGERERERERGRFEVAKVQLDLYQDLKSSQLKNFG